MIPTAPHYLLFTEAKDAAGSKPSGGRWRFVLEQIGTTNRLEEFHDEPGTRGERLQLLAVVRGIEALEQPSTITLITSSKYVGRGIRRGLTQWRQSDWQWERFGQMALIKNHDLWKRIDQGMKIHQLNCRVWQFDPPHIRTQVSAESDSNEMVENKSPFISPMEDPAKILCSATDPSVTPESIVRRQGVVEGGSPSLRSQSQASLNQLERGHDLLASRIKPIGHGRAYGYAMN